VSEIVLDLDAPLPSVEPTYRIDRNFEWNFANGPRFDGPWPPLPQGPLKDFFGIPVRSRFGIAASLLANAKWLGVYARLGFDILSYKTVRLTPRVSHPIPTWHFLDEERTDRLEDVDAPQWAIAGIPDNPSAATVAGSLGVPSQAPSFWEGDIRRCRDLIRPGQALVVSLVASVGPDTTTDSFLAEFEELAARVRAAGAQVVEANLSCPNVQRREGEAYRDPDLAARIGAALRRGAGTLPVLMKVGGIEDPAAMRALLRAVDGVMDGVIMMNGLSREVVDPSGAAAFGENRRRAGITGGAIYRFALRQVREAMAIVEQDRLAIKVLGCGGITSPERVRSFLDAGAYAALAATAVVWNPYLAVQVKRADPTI
jgi:dihydroorotate dehydrogenase (NAD+) catalytic subunit